MGFKYFIIVIKGSRIDETTFDLFVSKAGDILVGSIMPVKVVIICEKPQNNTFLNWQLHSYKQESII